MDKANPLKTVVKRIEALISKDESPEDENRDQALF